MNKRSISIIVPVYNSQQTLVALHKRLNSVFTKLAGEFEIIFVNDGSVDNSWEEIQKLVKNDLSDSSLLFLNRFLSINLYSKIPNIFFNNLFFILLFLIVV